jgi:hypothetical protein
MDMYTFERLLDYELAQSMRYRRYVSLVMFCLKNIRKEFLELIRNNFRQSDEVLFCKEHFVVMMGTTSKSEAIKAVDRYNGDLEGCLSMCCSISSFPDDGKNSKDLLNVLHERMNKAMQLEASALVAN